MADFPSPWIHFGGDEVDLRGWNQIPAIADRLHSDGLTNTLELEHNFLRQTSRFITQQGRIPMGWDEIVPAHPEPGTVIFWWRHNKPEMLREALAEGYSVVLAPRTPCYFDYPQNSSFPNTGWKLVNSTDAVYDGPKIPENIPPSQRQQILGVEACLWTERVASTSYLEFMTLPRMPALAEMAWTPDESRNFKDFKQRLKPYLDQYRREGIHYYDGDHPQSSWDEARQSTDGQTVVGSLQLH